MRTRTNHGGRALRLGMGAVALLAVTATTVGAQGSPAPGGAATDGRLTVSVPPGYLARGAARLSARETGTPVAVAEHATEDEVLARIRSGDPTLDVVLLSGPAAASLAADGFLAALDARSVPNLEGLYAEAFSLPHDPGNRFSAPYAWGTTGLCARTDLLPVTPTGWSDLLSPADGVAGRTTLMADPRWLLLPAQKALGLSANTTDAAELEQARGLLAATAPTLQALDSTTFHQRLVSGEASLVQAWDAWCDYAIADPAAAGQVAWVAPAEGSDLWVDVLAIPTASPDRAAAAAFIDLVLRPKVHVRVTEDLLYKVPGREAMARLDPALVARFPNLAMTPAELVAGEMLLDVGDAGATYQAIAAEVAAAVTADGAP
jgi:spermidine/putrescine transport system substrate-binding protein